MSEGGPAPLPGVLAIDPYVGGESEAAAARVVRLASNEGALGSSPRAIEAYRAAAAMLHRYPDGHCRALRSTLARCHGLEEARIVCGAGSDELIALLISAYAGPGDEVLYSRHGFLMYKLSALAAGATPVAAPETDLRADVDALLARVSDRTRLVFLANPNNPTGSFLTAEEVARLHAGLPERVLLVLDAAYAEYIDRPDYEPGAALVDGAANVVMTRTFSKIYGLGALRLGWAYCPAAVADVLNRVRGPFNVNAAAQVAGAAAVDDQGFVEASRRHNAMWRDWTGERLRELGLTVHPSIANFLLVDFAPPDGAPANGEAAGRAEEARLFLKERGILLRQMGAYGLPHCLRMSIGTADEMRLAVECISDFLDRPA
jgi:histidinol-phosphate aminotransferase